MGVELDEPVGRNDGTAVVEVEVAGEEEEADAPSAQPHHQARRTEKTKKRLFQCRDKFGVFVRPEKVEVGDEWAPLDDLGVDESMEEI